MGPVVGRVTSHRDVTVVDVSPVRVGGGRGFSGRPGSSTPTPDRHPGGTGSPVPSGRNRPLVTSKEGTGREPLEGRGRGRGMERTTLYPEVPRERTPARLTPDAPRQ